MDPTKGEAPAGNSTEASVDRDGSGVAAITTGASIADGYLGSNAADDRDLIEFVEPPPREPPRDLNPNDLRLAATDTPGVFTLNRPARWPPGEIVRHQLWLDEGADLDRALYVVRALYKRRHLHGSVLFIAAANQFVALIVDCLEPDELAEYAAKVRRLEWALGNIVVSAASDEEVALALQLRLGYWECDEAGQGGAA